MSVSWDELKKTDYTPHFEDVRYWLKNRELQGSVRQSSRRFFRPVLAFAATLAAIIGLYSALQLPIKQTVILGYVLECSISHNATQSENVLQSVCWYNTENATICESLQGTRTVSYFQVAFLDMSNDEITQCLAALKAIKEVTSVKINTIERAVQINPVEWFLERAFRIHPKTLDITPLEKELELRKHMEALSARQCA